MSFYLSDTPQIFLWSRWFCPQVLSRMSLYLNIFFWKSSLVMLNSSLVISSVKLYYFPWRSSFLSLWFYPQFFFQLDFLFKNLPLRSFFWSLWFYSQFLLQLNFLFKDLPWKSYWAHHQFLFRLNLALFLLADLLPLL